MKRAIKVMVLGVGFLCTASVFAGEEPDNDTHHHGQQNEASLVWAVRSQSSDVVQGMLGSGVVVGEEALAAAERRGDREIIRLLQNAPLRQKTCKLWLKDFRQSRHFKPALAAGTYFVLRLASCYMFYVPATQDRALLNASLPSNSY